MEMLIPILIFGPLVLIISVLGIGIVFMLIRDMYKDIKDDR